MDAKAVLRARLLMASVTCVGSFRTTERCAAADQLAREVGEQHILRLVQVVARATSTRQTRRRRRSRTRGP